MRPNQGVASTVALAIVWDKVLSWRISPKYRVPQDTQAVPSLRFSPKLRQFQESRAIFQRVAPSERKSPERRHPHAGSSRRHKSAASSTCGVNLIRRHPPTASSTHGVTQVRRPPRAASPKCGVFHARRQPSAASSARGAINARSLNLMVLKMV